MHLGIFLPGGKYHGIINIKTGGSALMKLNSRILAIIVLIVIASGVGMAFAMNLWKPKTDDALLASMETMAALEAASSNSTAAPVIDVTIPTQYNPSDIKGTNTFKEISAMFYIPVRDLGTSFGLTSITNYADMRARELKTVYTNLPRGITLETESVRIFVAIYKSKPYTYSNTAYLPKPAVALLKERIKLTPEQVAYMDSHTLDISSRMPSGTSVPVNVPIITGETTFQRVIELGVPVTEIEKILGSKLTSTAVLIKDYASQKGLDFLVVVGALQDKINLIYVK
jgi:hypothetical protein